MLEEERRLEKIGTVKHFFTKISVIVIDLSGALAVGDKIVIRGASTDFEQVVDSMQIEHENVESASTGQSVGLKVKDRAREGDVVYKVV